MPAAFCYYFRKADPNYSSFLTMCEDKQICTLKTGPYLLKNLHIP